jgi:hypothetical protein
MSEILDKAKEVADQFGVEGLLGEIAELGKQWAVNNADDVAALGADGAKAVWTAAMLKEFPEEIEDPELNLEKMEAAQKLLELAADHEERIDKLEEAARALIKQAVKRFLGRAARFAMKAAVIALV